MVRRERRWVLGAQIALAVALAAVACLPDLSEPRPPLQGPPTTPLRYCGDGLVESRPDGGDAGESCDPGDAQAPGCRDCHVTCSGTIDDAGAHCYFVLSPATAFSVAVLQCSNAGAHLVTFASEREAAHVESIVDAGYWVGLTVDNTLGAYGPTSTDREPGFPLPSSGVPCSGCFGRGADGGAFPLAPDVEAGAPADCIASELGRWYRVPCTGTRELATVCEREPVGLRAEFCNGPFCTNVPATAGAKTYLVSLSPATADDARDACRQQGGRLVVLASREEREQLVREVRGLSATSVWIGLARGATEPWTWDDGSLETAHPSPWGSGEPQASGASRAYLVLEENVFDTQLAHAETNPSAARPYVCERTP